MPAEKSDAKNPSSQPVSSDGDFVLTRVFDAPRALVFKCWTDPRLMAQWWGPHGFINPICELDVRPGGSWRIVMRGPDGADHPAKGVYREIVEPERIVWIIDHSDLPDEWHDMVNPNRPKGQKKPAIEVLSTVTFEEMDGKTRLTIRSRFESAAIRDALLKIGMNEGWSQSLERLASVTAKASAVESPIPNPGKGNAMKVQAYLSFDGRTEEAFEFYRSALGAEKTMLMRFKDCPVPLDPKMVRPGTENKIMHMQFRIGETVILASDGRCTGEAKFQGVWLSLTVSNDVEAQQRFAALADGGQVTMPLAKTFFSSLFGTVVDRFGVQWMFLVGA